MLLPVRFQLATSGDFKGPPMRLAQHGELRLCRDKLVSRDE
jgi:hypothetical protein